MATSPLFIGYAHKSCSPEQATSAFENALNEDGIVARVDSRDKKNDNGEDFKVFFVHFDHKNRQLQHMYDEIARHGFVVLTYAREWDKRRGGYVERYWKVFAYKTKQTPAPAAFVPRLMTSEEATAQGISAPKKTAAAETKTIKLVQTSSPDALDEEGSKPANDWTAIPNMEWDIENPPPPPTLKRSERYVGPELTEEQKARANDYADELMKKHVQFTLVQAEKSERRKAEKRQRVGENMFAALSLDDKPDPFDDDNWDAVQTVKCPNDV